MNKGAIFLLFFPLIVIIIRTASYWLHQQHHHSNVSTKLKYCWHWRFLLHFRHSVAVISRFLSTFDFVLVWFFWTPFTRLLSLICLIFIMPFSTNVMSPSPMCPIYRYHIHAQNWSLCGGGYSIQWQGWSQWIVLKSVPNGNPNREKKFRNPKSIWSVKKNTRAHKHIQIQRKNCLHFIVISIELRFQSISSIQKPFAILILSKCQLYWILTQSNASIFFGFLSSFPRSTLWWCSMGSDRIKESTLQALRDVHNDQLSAFFK